MTADIQCLIYCALPYAGCGWPQTCINIISNFPKAGVEPILVVPRVRRPVPDSVTLAPSLDAFASRMPWRFVAARARSRQDSLFYHLASTSDPASTVAYFWPGAPIPLIQAVRRRGIVAVRELINCYQGTAKRLLDKAYADAGLIQTGITDEAVDEERRELSLFDYVFASNEPAEASLLEAGVAKERILSNSFGWSPSRFANGHERRGSDRFYALFVGTLCIRKGITDLLQAWQQTQIDGELLLVGEIEPAIAPLIDAAIATGRVRHIPFTDNLANLYRSADAFIFPTLEEGGPQVTIEAAGCALPVITTPMGSARLIRNDVNGLIVEAGDVAGLARALGRLAGDPAFRARLGCRAAEDAKEFAYDRVSEARGHLLAEIVRRHRREHSHSRRAVGA